MIIDYEALDRIVNKKAAPKDRRQEIKGLFDVMSQTCQEYQSMIRSIERDDTLSPAGKQAKIERMSKAYGAKFNDAKAQASERVNKGLEALQEQWTEQAQNTFTAAFNSELAFLGTGAASERDVKAIADKYANNPVALSAIAGTVKGADDIHTAGLQAIIPQDKRDLTLETLGKLQSNIDKLTVDGELAGLSLESMSTFVEGLNGDLSHE